MIIVKDELYRNMVFLIKYRKMELLKKIKGIESEG